MKNIIIPSEPCPLAGVLHTPKIPSGKTLIISHGFRGSKEGGGRAVRLAEAVAAIGFTVIRYNFTPLQNLSCQIAELTAVMTYARQTIGGQLFLLGRSMGGSASLAAASADKNINGLILWATPWDLTATFRLALGSYYEQLVAGKNVSATDEYGDLVLTPDFIRDFERHNIPKYVKQLGPTPILILHGSADNIVPVSQARTVYELASGPKELVQYPDGDHHLAAHTGQASLAITTWLKKFL